MNKQFFFDIDGTLISCADGIYSIPSSTRYALDKLKENGQDLFLATGRAPCFLLDGVSDYDFSGIVSCNGALVVYEDRILYKATISKDALLAIKKYISINKSVVYLESKDCIYALNTDHPIHDIFIAEWGMKKETIIYDFNIEEVESYIGMIVLNDDSEEDLMRELLSPYFNIQKHQQGLSFDLTIKGESKAKGIQELVRAMSLDISNTVAFGDGRNDIEMLEVVGQAIAMGNAATQTKENADYITKDMKDDGIVYALMKLGYIH